MKKILMVLILAASTSATAQNLFADVRPSDHTPQPANLQRMMSVMARMSVYALICGDTQDSIAYSRVYSSQFTEQARGMVSFGGRIYRNPIENMRNRAMLDLMLAETQMGGRAVYCSRNRADFNAFIRTTSLSQLNSLISSVGAPQDSSIDDTEAIDDHSKDGAIADDDQE